MLNDLGLNVLNLHLELVSQLVLMLQGQEVEVIRADKEGTQLKVEA